jgi:hypothetical protein
MKSFWASALVMGALLAGVNTANADMCNSDWSDQNCGSDASAAWGAAPSSFDLFNSNSPGRTPGNLSGAVLEGTTTNPTGIDGLVVGGATYNVTFSLTLNSFTEGSTLSTEAASALSTALATLKVTALNGQTGYDYSSLDVDNTTSYFDAVIHEGKGTTTWFSSTERSFPLGCNGIATTCVEAADFVQVDVPEPGTVSLFGVALLAFGGMSLRRKFV